MTLHGILGIGRSGMVAAAFGATNASQNATNATTEGYSRRLARFEPEGPWPQAGVRTLGATRIRDRFVERRLLGARSEQGFAEARVGTMEVLDTIFADSPGNLQRALEALQTATTQLTAHPKDPATRIVFLETAASLADAFQRNAERLQSARGDANERIVEGVGEVNQRLRAIGDLSQEISRIEATGGEASDLRDRREQLVREVSDRVPLKVIESGDGHVDVMLAGQRTLVDRDGTVKLLETQTDPATGDVTVDVAGSEDVTRLLTSGTLGGLVDARDGALADARTGLDQLAFDLSAAFNAVHAAGVGLDGETGRNLFTPLATVDGAALSFGLSADVAGNPDAVAAADDAAELPGDNRNAFELEALFRSEIALGGTATIDGALSTLVGTSASRLQSARFEWDRAEDVVTQVSGLREAVSGVSTDEEMIDLAKFQRAFQASARVIQVADEMLAELVNLKR